MAELTEMMIHGVMTPVIEMEGTAEEIDFAAKNFRTHARRHAADGEDPITLGMLGAAASNLSNVSDEDMLAKITASGLTPVSMDLLWENASPTSSFAEQTIPLDTSAYDVLAIITWYSTTISYGGAMEFFVLRGLSDKETHYTPLALTVDHVSTTGSVATSRRRLTVNYNRTSITFFSGYHSDGSADDTRAIPTHIYGLKGVSY